MEASRADKSRTGTINLAKTHKTDIIKIDKWNTSTIDSAEADKLDVDGADKPGIGLAYLAKVD